jgi:protein TonB
MTRPFISFAIAFFAWFLLLVIFYFTVFKESEAPPVSITIDARMVSENEQQEKKSAKNFATKEVGKEKLQKKETAASQDSVAQKQLPLFSPLPKIPDELRDEAFNSAAVARFYIAVDGSVLNVELIHPCNNPRLNQMLLNSLKTWQFVANGQTYTQEIRVIFEVK